jgi:hypothetical protein
MSQIPLSSIRSWVDAFRTLKDHAEAQRGKTTVQLNEQVKLSWPCTTGRDVAAIGAVFDNPVRIHAPTSLVERWSAEIDLLTSEPVETRTNTYVGNRSFWMSLVAMAIELDQLHAPLPEPVAWDAAIHELAAKRIGIRLEGGRKLVTVFDEPTWEDMGERQLQFFRHLRGDEPGGTSYLDAAPQTLNGDVVAVSTYWTAQLDRIGGDAIDTYHRLLHSCWRDVTKDIVAFARSAPPDEIYPLNAMFWKAVMLLSQSEPSGVIPAPWAVTVPAPAAEHRETARNAAPVDKGVALEFPAAKTWDEAARMQRDAFSQLRGEDPVAGGLVVHIPRTTISDVRQLAGFWSRGLQAAEKSVADVSASHVLARWQAAAAEVARIPSDANPETVYAHNTEFWTALMTIAIQIAVTDEAPSRWTLIKQATKVGIDALPQTISDTFAAIADLGKKALSDALVKPLIYVGGGIAGAAVLYLLFRTSKGSLLPERPL